MKFFRILSLIFFVLSPIFFSFVLSLFGFGFDMFIIFITTLIIFAFGIVSLVFFLKHRTNIPTILTSTFVYFVSIVMFRLSTPFLSDGEPINWLYVFFRTESVASISFPYLIFFLITAGYFLFSCFFIYKNLVKVTPLNKKPYTKIYLISLMLVIIYFIVFFFLKATTTQVVLKNNLSNVFEESFENRERTTFIHENKNVSDEKCGYILSVLDSIEKSNLEKYLYKTECIEKILNLNSSSGYQNLPYEIDKSSYLLLPIKSTFQENAIFLGKDNEVIKSADYEKGDILAVTVYIPREASFSIDSPGNPNSIDGSSGNFNQENWTRKDGNMIYFQRSEHTVTSHGGRGIVATLFYPINTDLNLNFKIASYIPEEENDKMKVLDAAILKTKFSNPLWLQDGKAEKQERLFMEKSVDLRIGDSRKSNPLKYGETINVKWGSSSDIEACNLRTSFHSDNVGFVLIEEFYDLPPSGQKSITLRHEGFDAKEIELDLSCGTNGNSNFIHDTILIPIYY